MNKLAGELLVLLLWSWEIRHFLTRRVKKILPGVIDKTTLKLIHVVEKLGKHSN